MYDIFNNDNKEDQFVTVEEIMEAFGKAFEEVDVRGHGHLYVPGNVIYMFDSIKHNKTKALQFANGTSRVLRTVEPVSRMLIDHMSTSYRSSIKSLLNSS